MIFFGVSNASRAIRPRLSPRIIITTERRSAEATAVWTAFPAFSLSPAPMSWATTTFTPTERPAKPLMKRFTMYVVAPTAARASLPTKSPSMNISSQAAKNIWSIDMSIRGNAKRIMFCRNLPDVISIADAFIPISQDSQSSSREE